MNRNVQLYRDWSAKIPIIFYFIFFFHLSCGPVGKESPSTTVFTRLAVGVCKPSVPSIFLLPPCSYCHCSLSSPTSSVPAPLFNPSILINNAYRRFLSLAGLTLRILLRLLISSSSSSFLPPSSSFFLSGISIKSGACGGDEGTRGRALPFHPGEGEDRQIP